MAKRYLHRISKPESRPNIIYESRYKYYFKLDDDTYIGPIIRELGFMTLELSPRVNIR